MEHLIAPRWSSSALLTIDMQRDFTYGANAVPGTTTILPKVAELAALYRRHRLPVFHAVRFYDSEGVNAELCRKAGIAAGRSIVVPNSEGAELVEELMLVESYPLQADALLSGSFQQVGLNEYVFYKPRWSAFFSTPLADRLRSLGVDTIVVCGCNFPNCPSATLFDASSLDFRAVLASDATSMIDDPGVERMRGIGVVPMTVEDIDRVLLEPPE